MCTPPLWKYFQGSEMADCKAGCVYRIMQLLYELDFNLLWTDGPKRLGYI